MQAGPSNILFLAQSKPKVTRLAPAGITVMEDYLKEHGAYPPLEDRRAMLQRIRSIPGAETYELTKLTGWFKRRQEKPVNVTSPSAAAVSLPAKIIGHLTILANNTPYPTPDLIETWATLLKVNSESITRWLAERRSPATHLPTPVSTSPEPTPEYQWDLSSFKADPTHSPTLPTHHIPQFCSAHAQEPPTLTDLQLIDAIKEASQLKELNSENPSTLEEFTVMFERYDAQMKYIIEQNEEYLRS